MPISSGTGLLSKITLFAAGFSGMDENTNIDEIVVMKKATGK